MGRYLYKKSSPALIAKILVSSMHIVSALMTTVSILGQNSLRSSLKSTYFLKIGLGASYSWISYIFFTIAEGSFQKLS